MLQLRNGRLWVFVLAAAAATSFAVLKPWRPSSVAMTTHPPERREELRPDPRLSFPAPTARPAQRRLERGAIHVYPLRVKSGELLELLIQQQDVDLQVSVSESAGNPLFTVDSPIGSKGRERVLLAPKQAMWYRAEVSGRAPSQAGPYQIWIAARPAKERDRLEAEAEKLFHQAREAMRLRDLRSPEPKLQEASRLWERTRNPGRQADALQLLGNLYQRRWDWGNSLHVGQRARSLYRRLGRFGDEGRLANDIGYVYEKLSNLKEAENSYREALALGRRVADSHVVAVAYYNLGNLARRQSRSGEALENLEQAREIAKPLQMPEEIKALTAIGMVYSDAGKFDLALRRFREALQVADRTRNLKQKGLALMQMGNALRLREPEQAQRLYLQAFAIQQRQGDLDGSAATLNGMGLILLSQKRYQAALEPLEKALRIHERKGSPLDQARTLTNLGWTYISLARESDARLAFERALTRARGLDGWTEAGARLGLARLEAQRRNPIAAHIQAQAAVETVEGLRGAVSRDLRTSFFATKQDAYDILIEILLWRHELQPSSGYDAQALLVGERARSRGLLDDVAGFRAASQGGSSAVLSLAEIQRTLLDPESLLLEYHLGGKASYLWLVSGTSYHVFELPPREELESLIEATHQALTASARREKLGEARRLATELSRVLLGPAAPWLGRKRLLISAPDSLQGIPFAVLPDPAAPDGQSGLYGWPKPLCVEHEIVKIPSASVVAALQARQDNRPAPAGLLAVLADPVFDSTDKRLASVTTRPARDRARADMASLLRPFKRLEFTGKEAREVLEEAGPERVLAALGFEADRELVLSGKLRNYRNLHFATHGWLQMNDADLTALVLSLFDRRGQPRVGFLRASEVSDLDLPADLVVLSACQTGLGEKVLGEGLVGLPQAFMAAGATRVLVSLWSIDDLATATLMKRFYHEYFSRGRSPAAALRQAQKDMWQNSQASGKSAPFYWGAFELQGDWRPVASPH